MNIKNRLKGVLYMYMCFSASASFIAGAGLSAVGVATIKKTKSKKEIPFASIPLLFGIQQALEGVVWLTFSYSAPLIHALATYGFTFFAYILWPVFIPFAIRLLEEVPWRKNVLAVFQMIGLGVGLFLLYCIVSSPVTSVINNHSIAYHFTVPFGYTAFIFYFIAGCGSCFISSHKIINLFGLLLALSLVITYHFYSTYIVSIWCFFSAILSVIVYAKFAKFTLKVPLVSQRFLGRKL